MKSALHHLLIWNEVIFTTSLNIVNRDGKLLTTSMEVAKMVGKMHSHLLRDIRQYCEDLQSSIEDFNASNFGLVDFFIPSTYIDDKSETRPCYLITKKGCEFIAHKLTGKKGTLFTAAYITAFHNMEDALREKQSYTIEDPIERAKKWIEEEEQRRALAVANENLLISNQNLTGAVITLSDRSKLSRVMRCLANKLHPNAKPKDYSSLWNELYTQLKYKYSIDLKQRKNRGKKWSHCVDYIQDDEWDKVNKTVVAILETHKLNAGEFLKECEIIKSID